jgi:hypothetical protein
LWNCLYSFPIFSGCATYCPPVFSVCATYCTYSPFFLFVPHTALQFSRCVPHTALISHFFCLCHILPSRSLGVCQILHLFPIFSVCATYCTHHVLSLNHRNDFRRSLVQISLYIRLFQLFYRRISKFIGYVFPAPSSQTFQTFPLGVWE